MEETNVNLCAYLIGVFATGFGLFFGYVLREFLVEKISDWRYWRNKRKHEKRSVPKDQPLLNIDLTKLTDKDKVIFISTIVVLEVLLRKK